MIGKDNSRQAKDGNPVFIAERPDVFRERFHESLHAMLQRDQVGAFILVLANSMQDVQLYEILKKPLMDSYQRLCRHVESSDAKIAPDDRDVFLKLMDTGIDHLGTWETVVRGDWEINLNPMRVLRPPRASAERVTSLYREFDAGGFHFNKPFLKAEILWEGEWRGSEYRVLYNKFPFAPWHLLIVPEPEAMQPQFLEPRNHRIAAGLAAAMSAEIPGFSLAYNSIGAGASVNQLHFQSFVREPLLPIENPRWQHNGGTYPYPLRCNCYSNPEQSQQAIQKLHDANTAYNLLYRGKRCYVIERRTQGDDRIDPWIRGAGWIETCGVFNVPDEATLQALDASTLERRLASLSLGGA